MYTLIRTGTNLISSYYFPINKGTIFNENRINSQRMKLITLLKLRVLVIYAWFNLYSTKHQNNLTPERPGT